MADDNPFAQYSLDDQNYIADQLRTAQASGKLNPAQMQGVQGALKHLPMSKEQSAQYMTGLATLGMGNWQPTPRAQFNPSPEGARKATVAEFLRKNPKGDEEEGGLGDLMLNAMGTHMPATGALLGGTVGAALVPDRFKKTQAVARATGQFAGGIAGDPMTWALGTGGGRVLAGGFAALGAKGAYEGAGELGEIWDREDIPVERKIELGTHVTLNALMAGLGGSHSVRGFLEKTPIPPAHQEVIAQKIESEWQQLPSGKMIRRAANPANVSDALIPTTEANKLAPQSFFGQRVDRRAVTPPEKPLSPAGPARLDVDAKPDTDFYAKAKAEWMDQNPGMSPDKGISWIARRSQELKSGKADPTLKVPDGGFIADAAARAKSAQGVAEQMPAGESKLSPLEEAAAAFGTPVADRFPKTAAEVKASMDAETAKNVKTLQDRADALRIREEARRRDAYVANAPERNPGESIGIYNQRLQEYLDAAPASVSGAAPDKPSAPKTPVSESLPSDKPSPADLARTLKPDRSGYTDLRAVDPDVRHEWINQHTSGFGIPGDPANQAEAHRVAKKFVEETFGEGTKFTVNSYLDKEGAEKHLLRLEYDEKGQLKKHVSPAEPEQVSDLSKTGQMMYEQIQDAESTFHQFTGGKHRQVLADLYSAVEKTIPDAPREGKLALYQKALRTLIDLAPNAKGPADYAKAFDVATKKSEGGFIGSRKPRISDEEWTRLAKMHVDTVLSRFEALPEGALAGRGIVKRLVDPTFRNSVYGSEDPNVVSRYEDILRKAGGARATDPVTAMGVGLDGMIIQSGRFAQDVMRGAFGTVARTGEQRLQELRAYRDSWNHRTIEDVVGFYDNVEHGNFNAIEDPHDRELAKIIREQYDQRQNQLIDMGKLDHFNENYVGRLWRYGLKNAISAIMQGRRNFSATPSALRARTYATFSEGLAAGLEPVTYNPVDMFLLKMHEMDKYLAAQNAFDIVKGKGLIREFDPKEIPWNWQSLDNRIFNTGGAKLYAPADVTRLFNRYLRPGLRGNVVYDSLSAYNNVVNQFNLGFSAFHATETAINATVSRTALGLQQLTRAEGFSPLKGVGNILAGTVGAPYAVGKALYLGNKVFQEYLTPGRFADMSETVNAIESAGGRVRMDSTYKNLAGNSLRNAWMELDAAKGMQNIPKAGKVAYRALGAALEKMSYPLMEYFVPRVKLGTAAMMMEDALGRLEGAPRETIVREMSKIWDSVDNRFGQVVYDNLMWDRAGKDLAHLLIRSVGWNFGTVRELGGSVFNVGEYKSAATGKGLGYKQSYTLALLGTTALMGYIMNAGYQGTMTPKIDGVVDLLYPATGRQNPDGSKERVFLKNYIHDIFSFAHDPLTTVTNKLAPEWHQIAELYRNADYYGDQIHPIHASTGDALKDPETYEGVGRYAFQQLEPFSVRNFVERYKSGEGVLGSLTSGAAVLPAPKWIGNSKAESLAFELFKTTLAKGPGDPITHDMTRRYHELASGFEAQRYTVSDITKAFKAGEITAKQYEGILDEGDGKLSPLERHVKQLQPHQLLRVWDVASPDEKRVLTSKFLSSWDKIEDKYPEAQAAQLLKKYSAAWKTFKAANASN